MLPSRSVWGLTFLPLFLFLVCVFPVGMTAGLCPSSFSMNLGLLLSFMVEVGVLLSLFCDLEFSPLLEQIFLFCLLEFSPLFELSARVSVVDWLFPKIFPIFSEEAVESYRL